MPESFPLAWSVVVTLSLSNDFVNDVHWLRIGASKLALRLRSGQALTSVLLNLGLVVGRNKVVQRPFPALGLPLAGNARRGGLIPAYFWR
jgi:hypothetical protein